MRSRFISEPLPLDAQQGELGARVVINPELDAVAVAEIVFRKISVKMLLAAMLVNSDHAALEDGEIALGAIHAEQGSGNAVPIRIFFAAMIHLAVACKLFSNLGILIGFVGHKVRFARDVCAKNWGQIGLLDALDVERSRFAAPFDQSKNRVLMCVSATDNLAFLAADESLVGLNRSSSAAHRRQIARPHCFADTMAKEPSGFHAARKHPLNLVGRNAFLAGAHQVNDLQPKMQRQMGTLENGSLPNGELSLAFIALAQAKASSLALHESNALRIAVAAMRANWPVWPQLVFDIFESGFLGLKLRCVENGIGHGEISYGFNPTRWDRVCQV